MGKLFQRISLLCASALLFLLPQQILATPQNASAWEINLVPFLWSPAINGTMEIQGEKTKVNESMSDVLKKVNMGFMFAIEARKGAWGLYFSPMYVSLKDNATVEPINVTLNNKMWILDLGGFYRLQEWQTMGALQNSYLDLRFGARYWNLKSSIDVGVNGNGVFAATNSTDWLDPTLGIRLNVFLTQKLFINIAGDLGGANIFKKSSHFSVDAFAGPGFSFTPNVSMLLGYKMLYVNRQDGSGNSELYWKTTFHGPALAVEIKF